MGFEKQLSQKVLNIEQDPAKSKIPKTHITPNVHAPAQTVQQVYLQ
jgi:hypothetical protein